MNKNRIDRIQNNLRIDKQPNGFLKIRASLTRTGIFVYRTPEGGTIREFRSPEEVFKADSLKTLEQSPLSLYHPPVFINSKNYSKYTVGSVSNISVEDSLIDGSVLVAGEDAIEAIELGIREISCGYTCDVIPETGFHNGIKYDAVQKNIKYNHVAIVPKGRAGSEVSLHLDSTDEYVIGEMMDLQKQLSETTAKLDAVTADSYLVNKEIAELKEQLKAALDLNTANKTKLDSLEQLELNFSQRVTERVSLETQVASILKNDNNLRDKSEDELKRAVISSVYGDSINLENRDSAAIDVLFEASISRRNDSVEVVEEVEVEVTESIKVDTSDVEQIGTNTYKAVDIAAGIDEKIKAFRGE